MAQGLVGPHINIVHGNNLTDAQLEAFVDLGVTFSITPENEMAQGHGHPITGRLRALGSAPSIGVDLESAISGDMFTVARMALASPARPRQRGRARQERRHPADLDRARGRGARLDHHPGRRDAGHGRPHRQPGARQAGRHRGHVARPARHVAGARCRRHGRHAGHAAPGCATCWSPAASPSATAGCCGPISPPCAPGSPRRANASWAARTSQHQPADCRPMKNQREQLHASRDDGRCRARARRRGSPRPDLARQADPRHRRLHAGQRHRRDRRARSPRSCRRSSASRS